MERWLPISYRDLVIEFLDDNLRIEKNFNGFPVLDTVIVIGNLVQSL